MDLTIKVLRRCPSSLFRRKDLPKSSLGSRIGIYHLDEEGYSSSLDVVSVGLGVKSPCSDFINSVKMIGSALTLVNFPSSSGLTIDRLKILLPELLSILKVMS